MTLTASIGVDIDSLQHYYRIHGLDESAATNASWTVGVPRFLELFAELEIPATFYCIGEDMAVEDNAERARQLIEAGHEVGNHTWRHPYDLTRLGLEEMTGEVARGKELLEEACGAPVVGFRSPGYNTNARLAEVVRATGHRYDTSVFPCVPYYCSKAAIMGLMRLGGRRSRSILGTPKVLMAPREPYTMSSREPHQRGRDGLRQYPVSVVACLPLIGTAFTALGASVSAATVGLGCTLRRHLTIEFHAVDLLGLSDDGLDSTLAVQPDLRVSVAQKQATFRRLLAIVKERARVERLDVLTRESLE